MLRSQCIIPRGLSQYHGCCAPAPWVAGSLAAMVLTCRVIIFHEKDIKHLSRFHYIDVIMGAIASQISSLMVVYSTVCSDADQRKHQSSASLAFVWGIHRHRWISRTKGQLRGKGFHLMTSSWILRNYRSCNCTQMNSCFHKYTVPGWLTSELR